MTHRPASLAALRLGLVAALLAAVLAPRAALAQDPGWLADLPSAETVLARFAMAGDPVQSLGRQCAALSMLERRFFRTSAIQTRQVAEHPATRAKQADYGQAFVRLLEQYTAAVGILNDEKRRKWNAMCENRSPGGLDRPLSPDEVSAVLPPVIIAGYDAAFARSDAQVAAMKAREEAAQRAAAERIERDEAARAKAAAEKRQFRWIALAVLALGGAVFAYTARVIYRLGKYEFENRTDAGVVQFKSYGSAILHSLKGQVTGVIFLVSGLMVAGGIAMLLSTL
jgi:hypothetical protein